MKLKKIILSGFLGTIFLYSCGNEETVGQQPIDNVPPGIVTNVSVKSIAGGAVFRYTHTADR